MTAPIRDIYAWMISTLENDTELNNLGFTSAFSFKAPEDYPFPYFIIERQTGAHSYTFGIESYNRHWITVKSINFGTDGGDLGRQAMDRVRELFNNQRPTLSEGSTMIVRANTDFEFIEAEAGNEQFFNIGTVYYVQLTG